MPAPLRPAVLLALAAASVVLFVGQVSGDWTVAFALDNALDAAVRAQLLRSIVFAAAATGGLSFAYARIAGPRQVERLDRFARLLAPLVVIGLLPPLLWKGSWDTLQTALAIAVFTLLFERSARMSFAAYEEMTGGQHLRCSGRGSRRLITLTVVGAALFYALYMSRYTVYAHQRFQTYNFDLGQYDNVFWNWLHWRPLRCTPLGAFRNWSSIAGHADLSVFFLLPFYAIRPRAETLLVMQSFILGLGAIPIYLFAARRIAPLYAAVLAICYLFYPPLHGSNFYDFHMQPVASTFVLFTIYFVDARRWVWCTLSYIVAICCREDISIGLTMLGLYLVVTRHRPRAGIVMAVVGTIYFVTLRFAIMPYFGPSWFSDIYKDLYPKPGTNSFGGVIQTLMTNPVYVFRTLLTQDKLRYFLQIMTPIAFLPLRRKFLLPALAPGTLFTLLTTAYPPTIDIGFQYSGHFTPYIFAASALALAAERWDADGGAKMRASMAAVVVATFLCTLHWGAIPPHGTIKGGFSQVGFDRPTEEQLQKARDLAELAAMIPEEAKFAVSEEELPHVSGRLNVMTLKYGLADTQYLLYGTSSAGASFGAQALADGTFIEVDRRPGLMLLKRK